MCSIQTLCVNVYILGHWEATKCCERQLRTKITDCNLSWFHSCFTLINCFLCLGLYIFLKKKVCWYCVNHKHKHQISTFQTVEQGHVWLDNLTKMLFLKNKKTKTVSYFSASRLQLRLQFLPFHGARRWSLPQSPHYCSAAAETHREKTESVWWVAVKLRVWRKNICNKESVFSALL